MTDRSPHVWTALAEYLAGKGTAQERADMERRIGEDPELARAFAQVQAVWDAGALPVRPGDPRAAWAEFKTRAAAGAVSRMQKHPKGTPQSRKRTSQWFGLAAAGVAITVLGIAVFSGAFKPGPSSIPARTYTTATGERATVELPDGSVVTLAPQTVLIVESAFGGSERSVRLSGQAFFQVTNAVAAPFVVHTGNVATTVLGTAFDVKRYTGDSTTRIVVAQGKVQARLQNAQALTLSAGMLGEVTDAAIRDSARVDARRYAAWTEGRLDFRAVPVAELLATVERWYGVRFQVRDSAILHDAVSGSLNIQEMSTALKYLRSLLDVQMTFDTRGDTTVVILSSSTARGTSPSLRREHQPFSKPSSGVGL